MSDIQAIIARIEASRAAKRAPVTPVRYQPSPKPAPKPPVHDDNPDLFAEVPDTRIQIGPLDI